MTQWFVGIDGPGFEPWLGSLHCFLGKIHTCINGLASNAFRRSATEIGLLKSDKLRPDGH